MANTWSRCRPQEVGHDALRNAFANTSLKSTKMVTSKETRPTKDTCRRTNPTRLSIAKTPFSALDRRPEKIRSSLALPLHDLLKFQHWFSVFTSARGASSATAGAGRSVGASSLATKPSSASTWEGEGRWLAAGTGGGIATLDQGGQGVGAGAAFAM